MRNRTTREPRYAVLQQTLETPAVDRLRQAFESVRSLTAADAPGLASDAYGILVKSLGAEEARVLKNALEAQGILTELVPEGRLPVLPPTRFVRRLEFGQDVLLVDDPMGRRVPIEYAHISILAVGSVETAEFRRPRPSPAGVSRFGRLSALRFELEEVDRPREIHEREGRVQRRFIELILGQARARLTVEVDAHGHLLFQVLGEERGSDPSRNLAMLVRRLAVAVPGALLNRGAYLLRAEPPVTHVYPSRNAFQEEIIWMLWQMARRERQA